MQAFGKTAATAGGLQAGETVLIQGQLQWRKGRAADGTDKSGLYVNARLVRAIGQPVALA